MKSEPRVEKKLIHWLGTLSSSASRETPPNAEPVPMGRAYLAAGGCITVDKRVAKSAGSGSTIW